MVTIGDSAISGEAGRWAGNSNVSPSYVDTGANAYYDNATGTGEAIPGCHRSKAAEAHIFGGVNVNSLNLACSGRARTRRPAATSSQASTGTTTARATAKWSSSTPSPAPTT